MVLDFLWWGRTDSNHRSDKQQIYSLSPLATRELPQMFNCDIVRTEPLYNTIKFEKVKGFFKICENNLLRGKEGFASLRRSYGCYLGRTDSLSKYPNVQKSPTPNGVGLFCGGGGRIRTIEAISSRFTVCPLWPLGNSPIFSYCLIGAGRRTRTPDLLITNQLLYQLSYTGGSNRTRLL